MGDEDILRRAIEYAPDHAAEFVNDRPPLRQGYIDGALAERQRCAKICRDMAVAYEGDKDESVQWQARSGELRWVAGLIDDKPPPFLHRSPPRVGT